MRYLSVCSGIEAASVAWHPLGWEPVAFAEVDPFPSAVLKHHYPQVANMGDMTQYAEWNLPHDPEILVGGTPCQSFSVAGLRSGMADPRGNLALVFLGIADRFRPKWVVWENVPGVLSSNGGRDFGSILGGLGQLGYGWAYRILDAQFFGVPQRRRRVFLVGCLGDWRCATAVLFESPSMCGNTPKGRKTGQRIAATITRGFGDRGLDMEQIANGNCVYATLNASDATKWGSNQWVDEGKAIVTARTLTSRMDGSPCVDRGPEMIAGSNSVRRLTPRECERLQGFPDDWTLVPYRGELAPDSPRYRAIGNSMAVPVMRWIGERIQQVEAIR